MSNHEDCLILVLTVQVTALCAWLGEQADAEPSAIFCTLWQFATTFDHAQRQFKEIG